MPIINNVFLEKKNLNLTNWGSTEDLDASWTGWWLMLSKKEINEIDIRILITLKNKKYSN